MQHIKLQVGCLCVLLYIMVIYIRDIKKYKPQKREKIFDRLLTLGIVSVAFDGITAFTVNVPSLIETPLNMILHGFFLISLDLVIFALFIYMLCITGTLPERKGRNFLVALPFIINTAQFIGIVRKYSEIPKLTPEIMHEFIEKIVVHAPDKSSGHRTQQIDICFRFNVVVATAVADSMVYDRKRKAA